MQRRDTETGNRSSAGSNSCHRFRTPVQIALFFIAIIEIGLSATVDRKLKDHNTHPAQSEISRWAYIMTLTFSNITVGSIFSDWLTHKVFQVRRWQYQPLVLDTLLVGLWIAAVAAVGAKTAEYGAFKCEHGQVSCGLLRAQYAFVVIAMFIADVLFGITISATIRAN